MNPGARRSAKPVKGAVVERKRFGVAAHYRRASISGSRRVIAAVCEELARGRSLRQRDGKQMVELQPVVDWHKGRAVSQLIDAMGLDRGLVVPVYIGDDETDEKAFGVLGPSGVSIRVDRSQVLSTRAEYRLANPDEVLRFVEWLAVRR